eukprot:7304995-Alexandrium_andersonii.AAC.1
MVQLEIAAISRHRGLCQQQVDHGDLPSLVLHYAGMIADVVICYHGNHHQKHHRKQHVTTC